MDVAWSAGSLVAIGYLVECVVVGCTVQGMTRWTLVSIRACYGTLGFRWSSRDPMLAKPKFSQLSEGTYEFAGAWGGDVGVGADCSSHDAEIM